MSQYRANIVCHYSANYINERLCRQWTNIGPILYANIRPISWLSRMNRYRANIVCHYSADYINDHLCRQWANIMPILYANIRPISRLPRMNWYRANIVCHYSTDNVHSRSGHWIIDLLKKSNKAKTIRIPSGNTFSLVCPRIQQSQIKKW